MAIVSWVGLAQAVADYWQLAVGTPTIGNNYGFTAQSRSVSFKAVTATPADTAAGIVAAWAASSDARLKNDMTVTINSADATKIDVYGASDGRDVTLTATTGVTPTHVTTGTGPNYADAVANYSTGALPSASDTLFFSGLTRNDGPKYALSALSAISLTRLDVDPSYQGVMGLPDQSASGYSEFRTKYFQVKAANHRILSNGPDFDQRFRINGLALASAIILAGAGAQSGAYTVHLYNFPTTSTLQAQNISVATAPEAGQTCVLDGTTGVNCTNGAVVNFSSRTTLGAVSLDTTSGYLDCAFASLALKQKSSVIAGPNASCSTGSGIANIVNSGTLDWRSPSVPAAEVEIGTDATLITRNAVSAIPAFIAHMYSRSTLDDMTGKITKPFTTKYHECGPTDVTIILPEGIQSQWQVLT